MSVVELGPIVKTVLVRRSADDAFRIFTEEISAWWPMRTHTRARTASGEVTARVSIEARVGGRVFETLADGRELEWGEVSAYEPGAVFAMTWRMGRPAAQFTDVSVRFEPLEAEACRVTLTHANWQRLGAEGEQQRKGYDNGWIAVFEQGFGGYAGLKG
ncbi:MAG: SRPBCC domain-containing protein [Hyphomonadaceae bacterium]|mgnify:CR=1 FL=1|nr:SRPBCC domain-containing protein [Hyphomonadaceae bacterium]